MVDTANCANSVPRKNIRQVGGVHGPLEGAWVGAGGCPIDLPLQGY